MKTNLSDGEWKLMNRLWEDTPLTITQLTAALQEETGWGKHTVITMLSRLEDKGAVHHDGGTPKHYSAILQKEDAAQSETKSFLDKVYGGRLGLMMSAMVDSQTLTQEDIDELTAILENAKEGEK
ncbi:MAG: BlaI/MecI/CopY family transcriptional regulator [Oscillospiraceae bacterium]|nr:BlaI/MecI/CopY family transcriptional regulator [Oscillospiraceae bacterium]